jgi:hypothetical protein
MSKEVKEIDFGILPKTNVKIKNILNNLKYWDKVGLFISVNIVLYGILVWLGIFKLFGLI